MIVLNLSCSTGHKFEGWFASADAFDNQSAQALVICPVCGSSAVSRLPSGPMVRKVESPGSDAATQIERIAAAVARVAADAEDVAERFPEEARRIHYGEAERRSIKGTASGEETLELIEEGIAVLPIGLSGGEKIH